MMSNSIINIIINPLLPYNKLTICKTSSFIQSISSQNILKRRQFLEKLRNHSGFYGEHTSIIFFGKNHNENGSAQVLEYSNNRLTNLGIYDGVKLIDSYEKR